MKRRYMMYGGVIAALVVVNMGRWWLLHGTVGAGGSQRQAYAADDFRVRANVPAAAEVRRNLFAPQTATSRVPVTARPEPAIRSARVAPVEKPAASPEPTTAAPVAVTTPLDRLGLLGVIFRGGQGQAYLSLNKNSVIANSGDTVFGQFTVEKVAVDAVVLRDLQNNTTRRIPVSGR